MRTVLTGILALSAVSTLACSSIAGGTASGLAPTDEEVEQNEQEVATGLTRVASNLGTPESLTSYRDGVYFVTTNGPVTAPPAERTHDIWVKNGSSRARRLYRDLPGPSRGVAVTSYGLLEIDEAYVAVRIYPLDGSNAAGRVVYSATLDAPTVRPATGIRVLDADEGGFVVATFTRDADGAPSTIVSVSPEGLNRRELGVIPHRVTALKIQDTRLYLGTKQGEVFLGSRNAGQFGGVTTGAGAVTCIADALGDVFFGTERGLYVKRIGEAKETLAAGDILSITAQRERVVFGQRGKGLLSLPYSGGSPELVLALDRPNSVLSTTTSVFVTDRDGSCAQAAASEGCDSRGAVFRLRL